MSKITIAEAKERTGLGERTLRSYITQGKLPGYRIGPKMIRVDTDDLDRLVQPIRRTDSPSAA